MENILDLAILKKLSLWDFFFFPNVIDIRQWVIDFGKMKEILNSWRSYSLDP